MSSSYIAPFAKPVYVMLKPAGAGCNLACEYCYYLEKSALYPAAKNHVMSEELLEKFIEEYINCQTMGEVLFTWHGGEPLTRPIHFYRKAIALQQRYARGRRIANSIQTNGTLLTDEWCRFFKENHFLVGISVDGPRKFHDKYRKNRQGGPSFPETMRGVELLKKHGVEYNGMAVVNDDNSGYPLEFYRFFKEIECRYIQFTPIVERLQARADGDRLVAPARKGDDIRLAPFSVDPGKWGDFLCAIFDEWVRKDVGAYYIQLFDSTLANWVGEQPGVCTLAPTCGHAGVMEYNGDVYACDHYVFPSYKRGNIHTKTLVEMMYGPEQIKFGNDKQATLPGQCRACEFVFACNGECPKNRFMPAADGEPGLNYLCEGYATFFRHAAPYMDFMKRELLAQHPPANVMQWARRNSLGSPRSG